MMEYKTDSLENFQKMIQAAVEGGLTFEAGELSDGIFYIKYTGGY